MNNDFTELLATTIKSLLRTIVTSLGLLYFYALIWYKLGFPQETWALWVLFFSAIFSVGKFNKWVDNK